jgi:hypothetical protein
MKQNVGLSALIIAAFAFVIRSGAPGPQTGPPGRAQNSQSQAAAASNSNPDIEGPWLATRSFFRSADNPPRPKARGAEINFETPALVQDCVKTPGDCRTGLTRYFGIPTSNQIEFLIATVPDPLHSRLSLGTDSFIQAIEEAADASDWIFANEWLPWIDSASPEEKDPAKRREERAEIRRQETQPGILLFRRSASFVKEKPGSGDETLLVFLVGETPTAGVNSSQFQLARAYTRGIREPAGKIRIMGPTFSGSFHSLKRLLGGDQIPPDKYRVRSGTVTGLDEGTDLQDWGVDFRSATASTSDDENYFRSALEDVGIGPERALALIEDESEFGKNATELSASPKKDKLSASPEKKKEAPIRVLRFPRDISHLRNAYRDAVSAPKSGNSTPPDIEFSIKDPETGEDSIPIFSGSQSPLSQYGVVNAITDAIQRDGIRLVQVRATNVLDMLFLADVLKRQCPDTRILLHYPDVLLVQAAQNEPLTGTLVLASYPEFFESNDWMGGNQKTQPFIFPDANSEGIYNATVLLLNSDSDPSKLLADYHWRDLPHAPTWLLTLDRQGFLPVDLFPHTVEYEKTERWFQQIRQPADDAVPIHLPEPPRIWKITSTTIALACIVVSLWIFWISCWPTLEMDARFSLLQIDPETGWRRFHLFTIVSSLAVMNMLIWIPAWLTDRSQGRFVASLDLMPVAGCIVAVIAVLFVLGSLKPHGNAKWAAWGGGGGSPRCCAVSAIVVQGMLVSAGPELLFRFAGDRTPVWLVPNMAGHGVPGSSGAVRVCPCDALLSCRVPETRRRHRRA